MKDIFARGYHIRRASLGDMEGPVAVRDTQARLTQHATMEGGDRRTIAVPLEDGRNRLSMLRRKKR
jgi:hypothetical protein